MNVARADIVARLSFLSTEQGGRRGPTPNEKFRCLMTIDDQNFDVQLNLSDAGSIFPGQTVSVPLTFLNLELARQHCSVGKEFSLRETEPIAHGVIEETLF